MNQIEFAVHRTAHGTHRGALPEMADYLGLGEQQLRNKVNPEQEAKLSLDEAVRMMRKAGDLQILDAIEAEFGRTAKVIETGSAMSLAVAMLTSAAENADVTRAMVDGMGDKRWTNEEVAKVRHEIQQSRAALDRLEQALLSEVRE